MLQKKTNGQIDPEGVFALTAPGPSKLEISWGNGGESDLVLANAKHKKKKKWKTGRKPLETCS